MTFADILNSQSFTELELQVLHALNNGLQSYFGEEYSDMDCTGIAKETNLSVNTVKGVVGSLVKKDVLSTWHIKTDAAYDLVLFVDQEQMVRMVAGIPHGRDV